MFRIIKFKSGNYGIYNSKNSRIITKDTGAEIPETDFRAINDHAQFSLSEAVARTEDLNRQIELSTWTAVPNASELLRQEEEAAKPKIEETQEKEND
jgi:hypothetical protein